MLTTARILLLDSLLFIATYIVNLFDPNWLQYYSSIVFTTQKLDVPIYINYNNALCHATTANS